MVYFYKNTIKSVIFMFNALFLPQLMYSLNDNKILTIMFGNLHG